MRIPLLLLALACNPTPPPPTPPAAKAPEEVEEVQREPKKRPRSGSQGSDTGANSEDIVQLFRYEPTNPTAMENLTIVLRVDRNGQYMDVDYAWQVNGRVILSQRDTVLPHRYFEQGDTVQAEITIRQADLEIKRTGPLIIVGNTPPRILNNPNSLTQLDGFRVQGEDPDGGTVTYHIVGGPDGLSIGESSGVLRYKPSLTAEGGKHNIVIKVRDEGGAASEWRFQITTTPGSASETAKKGRKERRAKWEEAQAAKKKARDAAGGEELSGDE
jgi:hypothetical protein